MARRRNQNDDALEENQFPFEWVQQKLQNMGVEAVPHFKMDHSVVSKLNELKHANEEADKVVKDSLETTKNVEKKLMDREHDYELVLDAMKTHPGQLSSQAKHDLQSLINFQQARALDSSAGIKATESKLKLAVLDLKCDIARSNMMNHEASHKLERLEKAVAELQQYCHNFECFLKEEKETEKESKSTVGLLQQQISMLSVEKQSLANQYETLSQELPALEESESLADQVDAMFVQVKEEKEKAVEHQSQLDLYQDLPPDIKIAKSFLLNKKKQLQDLKGEIAFLMSTMGGEGFQ